MSIYKTEQISILSHLHMLVLNKCEYWVFGFSERYLTSRSMAAVIRIKFDAI